MEIKVLKDIMSVNQKLATENREFFRRRSIKVFNLMASPGAGKTSVLLKLIDMLRTSAEIYVIEGDTASSVDAERVARESVGVVQINTGNGCHLDAGMIRSAVDTLGVNPGSFLFIENVGNLICPSEFDLGEGYRVLIASVPEGHDKPLKYLSMFSAADVIVLNKIDLLPYIDFDKESFYSGVRAINEKAPVFEVSCKTGAGLDALAGWFRKPVTTGQNFK